MVKRYLTYISAVLTLLTVVVAGGWLYVYSYLNQPVDADHDSVVVVSRGQSFTSVAAMLESQQVISQPLLFRLYGRVTGMDTGLQAGEYRVPAGTTVAGLIEHLSSGRVVQYAVTLVEGRTLEENILSWEDSRLALTGASERQQAVTDFLELDAPSPEGLFFSDTYFHEADVSDLTILRRAHVRLLEVLDEEWQQRQPDLPYQSPYEALVMASIIERETAVPEERPVIAGVFVRRLRKGMRLQSDPTVIYGMGDSYEGRIRRKDLNTHTPYNTYRINGLPPTPIASVGREAIRAALNPAEGTSLYFVARGDGTHEFNDTLAGHNRAVRKYQLNRRSDYRSTPVPPVANREKE